MKIFEKRFHESYINKEKKYTNALSDIANEIDDFWGEEVSLKKPELVIQLLIVQKLEELISEVYNCRS